MNLFQNYLVEEFAEDYQEGQLSRRDALKLIFSVTGSMLVTNSILAACTPPPETALAPTATANAVATAAATATTAATAAPSETPQSTLSAVAPTTEPTEAANETAAVNTADIELPGEGAALLGALSRPAGADPRPVILVCHENRGLTEHIKDVTRRLAAAGYVALAVDLLSRQGGTSSMSSDQVPGILGNTDPEQFVSDFKSGWRYLQGQSFALAERVGMLGFCFGGGVTWQVATQMPELLAAVPFYGPHPAVEAVPNIQAAVQAIYAGNDQRINQGIPPIEEAMLKNGKVYEKVIYPNVEHAFHNDTSPRYNAEAAQDAWRRTLAWFGKYV
jgi:carboxymethylenebutenolidase